MTQQPTIHAALAAVMADVRGVAKRDRNEAQGFSFRGIDATVNAVGPALRDHGVVVVPRVVDCDYSTVEVGQNRRPMGHVVVTVEYVFHGPAGDSLSAVVPGEAMDSGDKAVSKAMSVAFRTCLLQALALPTDEPDPDSTSYERSEGLPAEEYAALSQQITQAKALDQLEAMKDTLAEVTKRCTESQRQHLRELYLAAKRELG